MTEHVLVFGVGGGIPARMRAFGETAGQKVATSVLCWPGHLAAMDDPKDHGRIVVLRPDASDEEWIALARAVDAVEPVTRIGCFFDDCLPQAALVAQVLGLDWHTPELVDLVMDQQAMRRRLAQAGVQAGMQAGVQAEADTAMGRAGVPYSVEAFSERGEHVVVAITHTHSDPGDPLARERVTPVPLEAAQTEAIDRHVRAVLDALGVEFGPTHTEVVLTGHGPRVTATRLRTGVGVPMNAVTGARGVDLIEWQLRQTLGEKVLPGIRATVGPVDELR
ncbi:MULTISPECIES: hypothetical protein [unclassified Streptomyces]|uniref:ATP-grasp domain-containing protein n=1 Tax=unclassified Streptomyces TaxID=2593676 RepID=UPI0033EA5B1C